MERKYEGNMNEIQRQYEGNTKELQREYEGNMKEIQRKYEKYEGNMRPFFVCAQVKMLCTKKMVRQRQPWLARQRQIP